MRGMELESLWNIRRDLDPGELLGALEDYVHGFTKIDGGTVDIQTIYQSKKYAPNQAWVFINFYSQVIYFSLGL
jgi:hypothetical protein